MFYIIKGNNTVLVDLKRKCFRLELHDGIKGTEFQRSFASLLMKSGHWGGGVITQGQDYL